MTFASAKTQIVDVPAATLGHLIFSEVMILFSRLTSPFYLRIALTPVLGTYYLELELIWGIRVNSGTYYLELELIWIYYLELGLIWGHTR